MMGLAIAIEMVRISMMRMNECNEDHLNEKLFYEIFGHGVDVARPVYLPASKKKVSILIVRFACFLILFLVFPFTKG